MNKGKKVIVFSVQRLSVCIGVRQAPQNMIESESEVEQSTKAKHFVYTHMIKVKER